LLVQASFLPSKRARACPELLLSLGTQVLDAFCQKFSSLKLEFDSRHRLSFLIQLIISTIMSMSPFFKPAPTRSPFFVCYKHTVYTALSTCGLSLMITTPWFIQFVRDLVKEGSAGGRASEALVYSTAAVVFVLIISILFFASYLVSIHSFRFCMSFGTICVFSPMLLAHHWRYPYAIGIMVWQGVIGVMFVLYSVLLIKYEAEEKDFGRS
jgi:hypothetical protein